MCHVANLSCFVTRQFLSRIYILLGVQFSSLKKCQCKKRDKYQHIGQLTQNIFSTTSVGAEYRDLKPFLLAEKSFEKVFINQSLEKVTRKMGDEIYRIKWKTVRFDLDINLKQGLDEWILTALEITDCGEAAKVFHRYFSYTLGKTSIEKRLLSGIARIMGEFWFRWFRQCPKVNAFPLSDSICILVATKPWGNKISLNGWN